MYLSKMKTGFQQTSLFQALIRIVFKHNLDILIFHTTLFLFIVMKKVLKIIFSSIKMLNFAKKTNKIAFYLFFLINVQQFNLLILITLICFDFRTMGQQHNCILQPAIERGISIKKEFTRQIKPKINPLKYINPLNPNTQQPYDCEDFSYPIQLVKSINSRQAINNQIQITGIKCEKQLEQPKKLKVVFNVQQNNINSVPESGEFKKVAVSWNKFIKMKQKKFTKDYQIVKLIGRGGFGSVYKVAMKNSNRIYRAAKKIMKESLKKQQQQSLFNQMEIMMSLDHPNITKLFEVYDESDCYVMILQLCEGGELFEKITEKTINQKSAKSIIRQILSALNYMHSMGIVHRDIKPENMLFQKKTKLIKIIDFGISVRIQNSQNLSTRVGTPYYIAPQVLQRNYNFSCDIWSLGVVLYMIMFNQPPFRGSEIIQIMQNILSQEPSYKYFRLCNYSLLSLHFLKSLLEKNPNLRLTAKNAMDHSWLSEKRKSTKVGMERKEMALSRITQFHFQNKLQAVVHTYIVSQLLTSEERLELLDLFQQLDIDKNGVVDKYQLQKAIQNKKFPTINEEKLQKILDYIDTNCSGLIDYTEFLVAAIDFKKKFSQQHFQQAFQYFDIDKNGSITFEEVSQFLQGGNQQQIRCLFSLVDKNGDGVISKQQFVQLLVNRQYREL